MFKIINHILRNRKIHQWQAMKTFAGPEKAVTSKIYYVWWQDRLIISFRRVLEGQNAQYGCR